MIEGGAAEESVGNQHFWLLLSETHEFCHCGANTRAADADAATRARDKGPKWKFVGDKKSLVIGLLRGSASDRLRDIARKRLYHNTHNWQR